MIQKLDKVSHLKSGSPSGGLDKVDVKTCVVEEGKRYQKEVSYENRNDVQLG